MNFKKIFKLAEEWEHGPTTERMEEAPTTDPLPELELAPDPSIGFSSQAGDMAYLHKYVTRCLENDKNYGRPIDHENDIQDILDIIAVQLSTGNTTQLMNKLNNLQRQAKATKQLSPETYNKTLQEITKFRSQLNNINVYMPYTANELIAFREYVIKCIKNDIKKLIYSDAATKEHRKAHIARVEGIINKLPRLKRRHR